LRLHQTITALFLAGALAHGTIVDRIAIVVDKKIVKDSDINEDLRITGFLNNEPPSFTPASRKQAASRLMDQSFLRDEVEQGDYPAASVAEAQDFLADLKKSRFANDAAYQRALASYGVSEEELKGRLLWQLTVLRFIDVRFRPGVVEADEKAAGEQVNKLLYDWLDQRRKAAKIVYLEESLK